MPGRSRCAFRTTETAVVVVDMQNAFASKGGMFDLTGFDISGAAPAVEATRRLLKAARSRRQGHLSADVLQARSQRCAEMRLRPNHHKELGIVMMRERPELDGKLLIEDGWDWQIIER